MAAGCIRTINEEACTDCQSNTNAYDALMGRLCPQCIARRGTQIGWSLGRDLMERHTVTEEEVKNDPVNEYLYTAPLIDHSDDIDAHLSKKPFDTVRNATRPKQNWSLHM